MKAFLLPLLLTILCCTCGHAQKTFPKPVNDIVPERTNLQRPALAKASLREADLLWQKRVWRVIDVNEKINHAFTNPERPFISILLDAADREEIQLYGTLDDKFSTPLTVEQRLSIAGGMDTIPVISLDDYSSQYEIVPRTFNPASVSRYRVQEIWYVDKNSSRMQVRILGIAPIVDEKDEMGNFLFEEPLFWVYYPAARNVLARERAWVSDNETAASSWEDVFEMRYFDSFVVKEGNVHDRRIKDYVADRRHQLLQGQRGERERQAKESDLWSH
ncbi:MAG: gliding motility associated protein GldN [Neolewinella sp.]|jgi:gliding motility associated protien GldN